MATMKSQKNPGKQSRRPYLVDGKALLAWILSNTKKNEKTGCLIWQKHVHRSGYGRIYYKGRIYKAPRLTCFLAKGGFALGDTSVFVLHRCDNPACINPDHLFLGSHEDNMADMVSKGRQTSGEKNPRSKLTEEIVREVRKSATSLSQREIANIYGVNQSQISRILSDKTWRHME